MLILRKRKEQYCNMAYRDRKNPKTGEKEYKVRYYFMRDGKKRDSETSWFNSLAKATEEAERLKKEKEKADMHRRLERRDKMLITAYEEYVDELKKIKENPQSTITYHKLYYASRSIKNNYMPDDIKRVRIKDLDTLVFKKWHNYMNSNDEISGEYMRVLRSVLHKFNTWMAENNYYNDDFIEENISNAISRCRIKKKGYRNREEMGERNIISILDLEKITGYYFENGIEEFANFYYYTLFYVLFYSGIRVEELCGLQWKFIDLRKENRTISIKNSINNKENREYAMERTYNGIYKVKNKKSVRVIPIFDYYYGLLLDYKESFKYEFDLNEDEIEECFVFPKIKIQSNAQNNPKECFRADAVRKELQNTLKKLSLANADLQMFRHSCATFLVLPPPDGLGYTEEKLKDYFGHENTEMLNKVYAKLSVMQRSQRLKSMFSDIYKPTEKEEVDIEIEMKNKLLSRISGDNEEAYTARKKRVFRQIEKAIENNRYEYFYNSRDKEVVEEYIREYGDDEIYFTYIDQKWLVVEMKNA